jgi:hypothetical protein
MREKNGARLKYDDSIVRFSLQMYRNSGFVREAKVNMDDNDEHVLYVQ